MPGKLFGIGAGPGDPKLLTLKAADAIQKCDVIAVTKTGIGEGAAYSIIEEYLAGKELLECRFSMEKDIHKRKIARKAVADSIIKLLDIGKDVGFVTLGDPTTYSTYMYIHKIISDKGFNAEIIPGITSYAAAAAALGIGLCEDDEPLIIVPAKNNQSLNDFLDYRGNKVFMKSGGSLARTLEKLKERGYDDKTKIACRVTMDGQRLYPSINDFEKSPSRGYLTIVITKP